MDVPTFVVTSRLMIKPLTLEDNNFIFELVNTKGWLKFIGKRNITSLHESSAYIQRILENENIFYWVVKLRDNQHSIGIITYIKRTYLDHHDIGFAFLPKFCNKGYAYEATN